MKKMPSITLEFAKPIIEDTVSTDDLDRKVDAAVTPGAAADSATAQTEDEAPSNGEGETVTDGDLQWTEDALERLHKVPEGFMRDSAKKAITEYAGKKSITRIDLAVAEAGIADARKIMAEVIGAYGRETGRLVGEKMAAEAKKPQRADPSSWGDLNEVRPDPAGNVGK